VNRSATGLEQPLGDFARNGLPQLEQSIAGLEEATRSLQGLVNEVRASPRDFIARGQSKEIEVQP
jgi:phospholipid/cholesterol/gamma-HCH transport system substrate-binding protein